MKWQPGRCSTVARDLLEDAVVTSGSGRAQEASLGPFPLCRDRAVLLGCPGWLMEYRGVSWTFPPTALILVLERALASVTLPPLPRSDGAVDDARERFGGESSCEALSAR